MVWYSRKNLVSESFSPQRIARKPTKDLWDSRNQARNGWYRIITRLRRRDLHTEASQANQVFFRLFTYFRWVPCGRHSQNSRFSWVVHTYVCACIRASHSCTVQSRLVIASRRDNIFAWSSAWSLCLKYYLALKRARHEAQDPGTRVTSQDTEGKHEQLKSCTKKYYLALRDRSALKFK